MRSYMPNSKVIICKMTVLILGLFLLNPIPSSVEATDALHITPSGNVGIGTTNPLAKLHVSGQAATWIVTEGFDKGGVVFADIGAAGNLKIFNIHTDSGKAYFATMNDDLSWKDQNIMVIDHDTSNVGIGTTSPNSALTVDVGSTNAGAIHLRGSDNPLVRIENTGAGKDWAFTSNNDGTLRFTEIGVQTRMVIDTNGNVGIGTTSPTQKLSFGSEYDQIRWPNALGVGGGITADDGSYKRLTLFHGHSIALETGTNSPSYSNTRLFIDNAGNIGIGTTGPSYKLHVNGAAAGTSWTNLSAREYKEDIEKLDDAKHKEMLAQLMKLEPTTYKYKKEFGGDGTSKLGFIAEEMPQEVLSKDRKGVDVYELLTYTIGAMKEQQKIISALSARIKTLEDKLE